MHTPRIAPLVAVLSLAFALFAPRAHAQAPALPGQQVSQVRLSDAPMVTVDPDLGQAERADLEAGIGRARTVGMVFGILAGVAAAPLVIATGTGLVVGSFYLLVSMATSSLLPLLVSLGAFALPLELLMLPVIGPIFLGTIVVSAVAGAVAAGAYGSAREMQGQLRALSHPAQSPFSEAAAAVPLARF